MKLLHTILSHWAPETVDLLMSYHQRLDPSVELLIAYGGPQEDFERINWKQKLFLSDPGLRGPTDQQNYCQWMRAVAAWAKDHTDLFGAVFFTETDHPMLRADYGQQLRSLLESSDCDFLGKWCSNREGSNSYFYLRYRDNQCLRQVLREVAGVDDSPIYEALATGMLFRSEVLEKVQAQRIDVPVFTEVIIPSIVRALGYRLGCFDRHGDFMQAVRYRPAITADELAKARIKGAWCCHPFKEHKSLSVLLDSSSEK